MKTKKIRWGILSTAQIGRKIWQAIHRSGNGIVVAVASRGQERAQKYIDECQAEISFAKTPRAVGRYEELITADDIDALYIPLPTGLRKPWVIRAAEAGKHVLCEKPCAVTVADLKKMIAACRRNRVQFMDGVMFMHTKRLQKMRTVLDDGKSIGKVRHISTAFQFNSDKEFYRANIRTDARLEPAGCLGDQGWYCIRIALWAMKWQLPERVSGRILTSVTKPQGKKPVPTEFSGQLFFPGGAITDFYCSFGTALEQRANISGTKGYLSFDDYVLPFAGNELAFATGSMDYKFVGCDAYMVPNLRQWKIREHGNSAADSQEVNMIRNFTRQAQSGQLDKFWPEVALKTQQVLNACLQSADADGKLIKLSR
ncbi:MAG TPA: Gfo/Idh/MocA family oxidoreductase [Opitutales bacterium]|jgi:predicted dehydrogenase|nr:Gfo/Idh/MocA family oxidoreductase [Opitutales bacterium]